MCVACYSVLLIAYVTNFRRRLSLLRDLPLVAWKHCSPQVVGLL